MLSRAEYDDLAKRVRERGLAGRIEVQKRIEAERRKRGGDPMAPPPRTDALTLTRQNQQRAVAYRIPPGGSDDDRAAFLVFTRAGV